MLSKIKLKNLFLTRTLSNVVFYNCLQCIASTKFVIIQFKVSEKLAYILINGNSVIENKMR